jgi:hypothetical protein
VGAAEIEPRAVIVQVAAQAQAAIRSGKSELEVRLEPPELGRIRVRVAAGAEGLTARIEASAVPVRDILEANLPALRHALAEGGVNVDRFSVSVGMDQHQWEQPHDSQAPAAPAPDLDPAEAPLIEQSAVAPAGWGGGRMIDAFA